MDINFIGTYIILCACLNTIMVTKTSVVVYMLFHVLLDVIMLTGDGGDGSAD